MKLSFKFKPKLDEIQLNIIEELSFHTIKFYNIVNYDLRENGYKSYVDIEKEFKSKFEVESLNFEVSNKLQSLINWNELQQVRIKWDNSLKQWYLIVIYKKQEMKVKAHNTNVMAVDLGLDNLVTLTFKESTDNYLFRGKKLKFVNAYTNKIIAHLQAIEMKKHGFDKFKNTKQINRLRKYRDNYVNDYLHKVSKNIIDKAIKYNVKKIIIGKLKGIKKNMNYNNSFIKVPIEKLAKFIEYKAKIQVTKVKYKEESYTSCCSSFYLESINKKNYDKTYRVVRGLFKSSYGLVNSDVNGSLNILRKEEKCISKLVKAMKDKGKCSRPLRIRVTC